jgi:hypothetical protein
VLVFYPLFMGFTLVYSGEHYVFDIVVGWLFAVLVCIGAALLERYRSRRRDVGLTLIDRRLAGYPDAALRAGINWASVPVSTAPTARPPKEKPVPRPSSSAVTTHRVDLSQ